MKKEIFSKAEYMESLRSRWQEAKKLSETEKYLAMFKECERVGLSVSKIGLTCCALQMEKQGLEGVPYIDAKTYNGWKISGFRVKHGEKSTLSGITWLTVAGKQQANEANVDDPATGGYIYPKAYALFHISQVEPITE